MTAGPLLVPIRSWIKCPDSLVTKGVPRRDYLKFEMKAMSQRINDRELPA
jgi:hypothetical protein